VQTGLEGDDGMVEIVSGLKEGDQIAMEKYRIPLETRK
jgi:hypothetical protein